MTKKIKHFKRWLALLLAVVLVAGTCVYSNSGSLWATEGVTPASEEDAPADESNNSSESEPQVIVIPDENDETDESKLQPGDEAEIDTSGEEKQTETESDAESTAPKAVDEEDSTKQETALPETEKEKPEEEIQPELPKEELIEKPEQTLTVTADDGAKVIVSAPEGALQDGAKVTAKVVTITSEMQEAVEDAADGKPVEILKAYDVTIVDVDGNEIQPDKRVKVTIQDADVQGENLSVYHMSEEGTEKVADDTDGNDASFEVSHFSIMMFTSQARKDSKQKVYVFVKLKGQLDGIKLNWNSWTTLGYVTVDLPEATQGGATPEQAQNVKNIVSEKKFAHTYYGSEPFFDDSRVFDSIIWEGDHDEMSAGLKTAGGVANNNGGEVEPSYVMTWHFDGYLAGQYTIEYRDIDNQNEKIADDKIIKDQEFSATIDVNKIAGDNKPSVIVSSNGSNYVYTDASEPIKIGLDKSNNIIKLYYRKSEVKLEKTAEIINGSTDGEAFVGSTIKYTINVENKGKAPVKGLIVSDSMPNGNGTIVPSSVTGASYNGKGQFTIQKVIPAGQKASITYEYNVVEADAGKTLTNSIELQDKNINITDDSTQHVEVKVKEKEELTVYGKTGALIYNGKMQTLEGFLGEEAEGRVPVTAKDGKIYYVVGLKAAATGRFPNGETGYPTEFTGTARVFEIIDNKEKDVTERFTVKTEPGKLTILPLDGISIEANSTQWEYDGQPHQDSGVTVKHGNETIQPDSTNGNKSIYTLKTGDRLEVTVEGTVTDVDDSKPGNNKVTYKLYIKDNESYTEDNGAYAQVASTDGTLTITPRSITIISETAEKDYDGQPLTKPNVSYKDDKGFVTRKGSTEPDATARAEGTVTNVGLEVKNEIAVNEGAGYKENNYSITRWTGKLQVTATDINNYINVDVNTDPKDTSKQYDGTPLEAKAANVTAKVDADASDELKAALLEGLRIEYSTTPDVDDSWTTDSSTITITNYGTKTVYIKVSGPNYKDVIEKTETISITKVPITLKSKSDSKPYDDKILTANAVDVVNGSWIGSEGADYTFEDPKTKEPSGQLLVGESENKFTYRPQKGTDLNNYDITTEWGHLRVTDVDKNGNPIVPSFVITKSHEGDSFDPYVEGKDVVTFTITVKNIYADKQTVTLTEEHPGVTFGDITRNENLLQSVSRMVREVVTPSNDKVFTLGPNEEISISATYPVTENDVWAHGFTNTVNAKLSEANKTYQATDIVNTAERNASIVLTKEVTADTKKDVYEEGDLVKYEIKATNNGNLTLTDVTVEDALTGNIGDKALKISSIAPNTTITVGTVEYRVKREDSTNVQNTLNNIATVPEAVRDIPNPDKLDDTETLKVTDGEENISIAQENPSLSIKKEVNKERSSGKKDSGFKLGEDIYYTITVTNNGNVTINGITVEDQLTGDKEENISLAPKANKVIETKAYKVTDADIERGKVVNLATVESTDSGVEKKSAGIETPTIEKKTDYTVDKEVDPETKKSEYKVGDTIKYKITVTSNATVTLKNLNVKDELSNAAGGVSFTNLTGNSNVKENEDGTITITSLAPETSEVIECEYKVDSDDAGKELKNKAVVTNLAEPGKDPEEKETDGENVEKLYRLTINYVDENNNPMPNITPHTAEYLEGKDIEYPTSPIITGYTADEAQINNGPEVMPKEAVTLKVVYKANNQTYTVNHLEFGTDKVLLPAETVEKDGNGTEIKYGQEITGQEQQKAIEGYEYTSVNPEILRVTEVNENNVINVYYAKRNDLSYAIHYFYDNAEDPNEEIKSETAVFESQIPYKADLTKVKGEGIEKKTYVLDRAEIYGTKEVIATVTGDETKEVTSKEAKVTAKAENNIINVYYALDENGPNGSSDKIPDSKEYTVTYTGNGGFTKMGEETFKDPNIYPAGYHVTTAPGENFARGTATQKAVFGHWKESETQGTYDPNTSLLVMPPKNITLEAQWMMLDVYKKAVNATDADGNPKTYGLDGVIPFEIEVKNIGDEELKDIRVVDVLSNGSMNVTIKDGEGYRVEKDADGKTTAAIIDALTVDSEVTVNVDYTVGTEDIAAGSVVNTATATSEKGATATHQADPVPMVDKEYQLFVKKSIKETNGQYDGATGPEINGRRVFTTDDPVTFEIEVTNTGNQVLHNVVVEDTYPDAKIIKRLPNPLAGIFLGYRIENGKAIVDSLAPNESVIIEVTYVIKESDLGGFRNVATAKADEIENPTPGTETIPVEEKRPEFTVSKEILNQKDVYEVGDRIEYKITVNNTGNMDLKDIVVTDSLANATGQVTFIEQDGVTIEGNVATITELPRTQNITLECSYEVLRADAGAAISNTASATGSTKEEGGPNPDPKTSSTEAVDVERDYQLTIHYVYAGGGTAAADRVVRYLAGETYNYSSPAIEGYTPDYAFIRSGAEGMPARDVEWTVVYTANPAPPTPTPTTTTTTPTPPTPPVVVIPTPAGPAPIPAPVLIGDEEVPLGGEVTVDDDGNVTVVPVEDEEVPLARDIDEHNCCILHFLLTLAAFIIYLFFTKSMKKRQAKINELRDQYETEVLKRKLGIADNDKDRTV